MILKLIDCTNRLIFPGIIDAHTHMGIPIKEGYSADDFESGSKSALMVVLLLLLILQF